jgi:hypothetical protein
MNFGSFAANPKLIEALVSLSSTRQFSEGRMLFYQGDLAKASIFLKAGRPPCF